MSAEIREVQGNAADAVVDGLVREGVPVVFGMTGDTILPVLDAIYKRRDEIRYITTKYEMSTVAMADGYSRITNQLGACVLHVGPAVSNAVLGAWSAQKDNVPLLLLSANMDRFRLGRNIWHEFDVVGVFGKVTKRSDQMLEAKDADRLMRTSIQVAKSGLPGVVHLDMPKDLLAQPATIESADLSLKGGSVMGSVANRTRPTAAAVEEALDRISRAARPVFIAGRDVTWAEAENELLAIAERFGAVVVTTEMGRGSISEFHQLSGGLWGHFGTTSANTLIAEADLVIGLGCQFSNVNTINWQLISPETEILQIEPDPLELGRQYAVDQAVLADSGEFLRDLELLAEARNVRGTVEDRERAEARVAELREAENAAFYSVDLASKPIKPQAIVDVVQRLAPEGSIFSMGAGYNTHFSNFIKVKERGQYQYAIGSGTMAWAFPAALGMKIAQPDRCIFVLIGDGDFSMSAQELETAVREDLPVVVIIYNDVSYGALRIFQEREYGGRQIGSTYGDTNWVTLAESYGAKGVRVDEPEDLEPAVQAAIDSTVVTVIDVRIDPNQLAHRTPEFKEFHKF